MNVLSHFHQLFGRTKVNFVSLAIRQSHSPDIINHCALLNLLRRSTRDSKRGCAQRPGEAHQ